MRLLLTGCAGFIGGAVAAMALRDGHEVIGIDNLNDAYDPALKRWRLDRLTPAPRFAFVRADVADRSIGAALAAYGPFDAAINLAARAGVRESQRDPWSSAEANVMGLINILEACREAGVPKLVQASTSSVYGGAARALHGGDPARPALALRGVQAGCGGLLRRLSPPLRDRRIHPALLHRLRPGGEARYVGVPLHPLD